MQIQNIARRQYNNNNQKAESFKGGRSILRTMSNPDSLASTIFLETFVTGGRGARAYKRGGFPEFRERFFDDVISAIFWMKGVDMFNALGNKIGEHVLKLPTTEFDVGKDALRTPFNNLVEDLGKTCSDKKALDALTKKLAVFKTTKTVLSTILAVGFIGFALPKINQAITEKLMKKQQTANQAEPNKQEKYTIEDEMYSKYSIDAFENKIKATDKLSFKGLSPDALTTVAYMLENNKICKMLSCDTGILTGRVMTARTPDEGAEYFFRDASSSFFYFASTPLVYAALQKLTKSADLTTIDPVTAKQVNEKLLELLKKSDGSFGTMEAKEFAAKAIGSLDSKASELLGKLPFKSDVISLNELKKYITDENLIKKAAEMAKLQPQQAGVGSVLTKQQVTDVLKNGSINTPEFMQKVFKDKFGDALTNPFKFIPMKKITSFRSNIDKYSESIIKAANKTNGGVVDKQLIDKLSKRSFVMSAGFRAVAIGVSAFALGYVIPKLQCMMTERKSGTNEAPGLKKYHETTEAKK